jgi:hypothetical protein
VTKNDDDDSRPPAKTAVIDTAAIKAHLDLCREIDEPGQAVDEAGRAARATPFSSPAVGQEQGGPSLELIPVMLKKYHEINWHRLDHLTGFLLSQVDGSLSIRKIIEKAGASSEEAARIFSQLFKEGFIGIADQ